MKKLMYISLFLLLTASHSFAQEMMVQRSVCQGFSLGGGLGSMGWAISDFTPPSGGGFGISLSPAYGFNEKIQIFADVQGSASTLVDANLGVYASAGQADLGARWMFGSTISRWRPFAELHLTQHLIYLTDNTDYWQLGGTGFGFGGGIYYFIYPELAITGSGKLDFGSYSRITVNGNPWPQTYAYSTTRIFVGMAYTF